MRGSSRGENKVLIRILAYFNREFLDKMFLEDKTVLFIGLMLFSGGFTTALLVGGNELNEHDFGVRQQATVIDEEKISLNFTINSFDLGEAGFMEKTKPFQINFRIENYNECRRAGETETVCVGRVIENAEARVLGEMLSEYWRLDAFRKDEDFSEELSGRSFDLDTNRVNEQFRDALGTGRRFA